ncbi:MAG: methionyl-tRNA formyltransferase [Betaproteobacteria bacterium]|nr:methionyl-tRNA formyltransferase [Betaproteobacteria bacterium]
MRLIFAGTPHFAAAALTALHEAGHDIPLVLTQPDRPAGRGMKLTESAVGQTARALGLRVEKPEHLKDSNTREMLADVHAEVMIVAAYGLLLPQAVLDIPARGCLNIHGSLLPRWRGAAPVQRAILAGDSETGVGIMLMEAGLDTGPVLLEKRIPIVPDDTSAILFEKLTRLGADAVVDALARLDALVPRVQSAEGVTYAHKLTRAEAPLDWALRALELDRQIRAFDPFPGAEARLGDETLKVWKAVVAPATGEPGQVLAITPLDIVVACGKDALRLMTVQKPGGRRQSAGEWARTVNLATGQRLG